MLQIDSVLSQSSIFGRIRSLLTMSPSQQYEAISDPLTRTNLDPAPLPSESRRKRRRLNIPEPGSLHDLMRHNSGTSLYVMPICWTDLHADLLDASWHELAPMTTPMPTPPAKGQAFYRPSATANTLTRELTTLLAPEVGRPLAKIRAVKTVLAAMFPDTLSRPRSSAELDMHFGARVIKKAVRVQVLWKSPDLPLSNTSFDSAVTIPTSFDAYASQSQSQRHGQHSQSARNDPVLAYIARGHLATIRQHLFRIVPHPRESVNVPVSRLQQLRSKMLMPANADKDAHFIAIFIAMAQRQIYGESAPSSAASSQASQSSRSEPSTTPVFKDVKVQLLTHDDDDAEFIVYEATVTATFLKRFHSPYRTPRGIEREKGIEISYTRVPIWPVLGLKERLGKVLGRDIAGDICDSDFELWGVETGSQQETPGLVGISKGQTDSSATTTNPQSVPNKTPNSSFTSMSAVIATPSPSPRPVPTPGMRAKRPREREALSELLNRSFEEKGPSASTLAAAQLTSSLRFQRKKSPSTTSSGLASPGRSPSFSSPLTSPAKRRRLSGPGEVDVAV